MTINTSHFRKSPEFQFLAQNFFQGYGVARGIEGCFSVMRPEGGRGIREGGGMSSAIIIYCIMKSLVCRLKTMVAVLVLANPASGQSTTWDPDFDGDNLIGIVDLLGLLSVFQDMDLDDDGVWDSQDDCIGEYDPCGICNGIGVDVDEDGICDESDDCIGIIDECGVCNGSGYDTLISVTEFFGELPLELDTNGLINIEDVWHIGVCENMFQSLSLSPSCLLAVDFSGGVLDLSGNDNSIEVDGYMLGPDRKGQPYSAAHPDPGQSANTVQGTCNDAYFGNIPTNYIRTAQSIPIIGNMNDEYSFSCWVFNSNPDNCSNDWTSIWGNIAFGVAPIENPLYTTSCYYESSISYYFEGFDFNDQWCGFEQMAINSSGTYSTFVVDSCFSNDNGNTHEATILEHGWNNVIYNKTQDSLFVIVNGELLDSSYLGPDVTPDWGSGSYGAFGQSQISISTHDFIFQYFRGLEFNGNLMALDDILIMNRALTTGEVLSLAAFESAQSVSIMGCTDCSACNFYSMANSDDGSCNYDCYGCLNAAACNFSPTATMSDGSCYFIGNSCDDGDENTCGDIVGLDCICSGSVVATNPCQGLSELDFYGKEYELIEICNQCWFAENLQTANFSNGDTIVFASSNSSWSNSSTPMPQYTIGPGGAEYGFLYNFPVGVDSRGVCPTGFHVPSLEDWQVLNSSVLASIDEELENVCSALNLNGTNSSGFTALMAGSRSSSGFWNFGEFAEFMTTSPVADSNWGAVHGVYVNNTCSSPGGISGSVHNSPQRGVSIRCVSDN